MKTLYCTKCGAKVIIKLGIIPLKCDCGAQFHLSNPENTQKLILSIVFLFILMSPLFLTIGFNRHYFQDSIILYAMALIATIMWYRIAETILVRLGLFNVTNIECK